MFKLVYDTAETTRPKKWSSKLKLNTSGSSKSSEKSPDSPYLYGTISGPGGSALSKSMKYAETWLYGSVRAQTPPIRPSVFTSYPESPGPVLISTPQKPTPHNYAVILCSCPEYLNGTKKTSSTKVSICKKCKGSRLPLTITDSTRLLVGGTVRGPQVNRDAGLLRAGTVRVQGTKSRPSILKSNGDPDPYDLMRRSRLAPPHETRIGSQFSTSRSRAKSISPCRMKNKKPSPEGLIKNRSKSVSRVNEVWIDEDINVPDTKKSILSCDINPYDLMKISKSNSEVEFDDDYNGPFQDSNKNGSHRLTKVSSDKNVKNISGQRIRVSNDSKTNIVDELSVYDPVNFDLKNYDFKSTDMSSALTLPSIKNESSKLGTLSKASSKKIINTTSNRTKQKSVSPKRPPRKIRNTKIDDDSESDNQRIPEKNYKKASMEHLRNVKNKNHKPDVIKSILKKPKSNSTDSTKVEVTDNSFDRKRKRVQFQVDSNETKVIFTAELNLHDDILKEMPENLKVESSDDSIAEGDIVSKSLQQTKHTTSAELNVEQSAAENNTEKLESSLDASTLSTCEIKTALIQSTDENINSVQQNIESEDNDVPKVPTLRRSESERLTSTINITPPKFLDTMALRSKSKHCHTTQVFLESLTENDVNLQQNANTVSNITATLTSKDDHDTENLSDSSEITRKVLKNLRNGITELPEPPPRLKSRSKRQNYVKTRFVRNDSISSTSDEWSDSNDNEQKTVLKVKQFETEDTQESSKESKRVLKFIDNEPRKTSIQINGNECYSTMNVSNDTPIYLSSVVVNDGSSTSCNTYQTGTTVTISVGSPQNDGKKSKSQVYIGAVFPGENKNDEFNNTYEEYFNESNSASVNSSISSILSDPVEAVKRNLIPHVCGKKMIA
ncbi:unnamed protein product [Pieris macdunnoughi]|uniref:Uncharacterized protein n=1 Tax=Pieris macdunnoughi TaxID=345717 RepID=A0A821T6X5_9NEOP|nr:unnamed protein product [Pieris macdunnoughi]